MPHSEALERLTASDSTFKVRAWSWAHTKAAVYWSREASGCHSHDGHDGSGKHIEQVGCCTSCMIVQCGYVRTKVEFEVRRSITTQVKYAPEIRTMIHLCIVLALRGVNVRFLFAMWHSLCDSVRSLHILSGVMAVMSDKAILRGIDTE
jgi:hypothetical protein